MLSCLGLRINLGTLDWFEYVEFNGDVHFFYFRANIPILGTPFPKSQNYALKMKFGTYTNSKKIN